jgi:hypothetical protein
MKKSTLYLHVGWSKTGTSAIQAQIQAQKDTFLAKGILYPQTLQWPDHSHHPFALSFKDSGVYKSDLSPKNILEKLKTEMLASPAESVLMSSELSPFYYSNVHFKNFVEEHFSLVKIIFTVRSQSELLLSLFNQLVKDPNVRYGASLFTLAMRNIGWLNFNQAVKRWEDVVGLENIHVIPYTRSVVKDFFEIFSVSVDEEAVSSVVNPSLPTRCLPILQAKGRGATDPDSFMKIRESVLEQTAKLLQEMDRFTLFSVPEQQAFDDYFRASNARLAEKMGFDLSLIQKKQYMPVKTIAPGAKLSL